MSFSNLMKDKFGVWREALLLPGETDPVESGLRELSEYFGISRAESLRQCENAVAESKREWEASPRQTPEQIKDFYRSTRSYIFEHVWWHATDKVLASAGLEILNYALKRGIKTYLDFGAGIGTNALVFASGGFNTTLADISTPMMDFARWRLQRRGIKADFIDLNRQRLPDNEFDLVTMIDVCEHLLSPEIELRQISRSMKIGGAMVFNCRTGEDDDRPMHILKTANPVWRTLRSCGFREIESGDLRKTDFSVVERVAQNRIEDWWYAALDQARYSRVFISERNDQDERKRKVIHPQRLFFNRIETILPTGANWLDVGCGRQLVPWWINEYLEIESRLKLRTRLLAGVDPDFAALRDNRSYHWRLRADSMALPFADASFDLVTSNMVFEHLEKPFESLMEIRRVLRRGGKMLLLTPNWLDIVTIAARAIPNRWHPAIVSRLEARSAADVYPTYFRFNRPKTIERMLRDAGFSIWRIEQLQHPAAYAHVPFAARAESIWHRLAARWPALCGTLLIEAEPD